MSMRRTLPGSPYLAAATGRKPHRVPVWFMRQAGRSLPEYRALRTQHSMMAACFDAELITEITLQPIRRHDVDAAILFSDIVVPLRGAGVDVDIVADVGPVIAAPVRTAADVDALRPLDPQGVQPVSDAVSLLVRELGEVPLIGFAGAPFTLASYLVEGGPSRHQGHDAGRTGVLACADGQADGPDRRFPAGTTRCRGGCDSGVRFVGGRAVAGRLSALRAAAQFAGVRHAGRPWCADDALRGGHRGTAGCHVDGRCDGGRCRLADRPCRRRGAGRGRKSVAGQPRSGGAAG